MFDFFETDRTISSYFFFLDSSNNDYFANLQASEIESDELISATSEIQATDAIASQKISEAETHPKSLEVQKMSEKAKKQTSFSCNTCEKEFGKKFILKRHISSVHEGKKPNDCGQCGKKFAQKTALEQHVLTVHEGNKSFKCKICRKYFGQPQNLKSHINAVHNKIKPHKCQICKETFPAKINMTQHIAQKHSGLKPFKCQMCDKKASFALKKGLTRHQNKCGLKEPKKIKKGDKIPSVNFFEGSPTPKSVNLAEVCKEGKFVIFGINGAFVPSCTKTHVPGYVELAEEFKTQGIKEIFCISVNDPFVMNAFCKTLNAEGKIRFLGDPFGDFAQKTNLMLEKHTDMLGTVRNQRFSILVKDGKAVKVNIEPDGTGVTCTHARFLLKKKQKKAAA